jgi:hypothetical protein
LRVPETKIFSPTLKNAPAFYNAGAVVAVPKFKSRGIGSSCCQLGAFFFIRLGSYEKVISIFK